MDVFKLLLTMVLSASGVWALEIDQVALVKEKSAYTYIELFDDVYVTQDAVSTETRCSVSFDVQKRSVNVGDCNIKRVMFFTKGDALLGNITRSASDTRTSFKAGNNYSDVNFSFNMKDAAYFQVEFAFTTQFADASNIWKVSCPDGYDKTISKSRMAVCYKPNCKPGYGWDSESRKCKVVPAQCTDGFVLSSDSRSCVPIPQNSYKASSRNWECERGYERDGGTCRALAQCSEEQYNLNKFACADIPSNAHKLSGGTNPWACDDGFVQVDQECLEIPTCSETEILDTESLECLPIQRKVAKPRKKNEDLGNDLSFELAVQMGDIFASGKQSPFSVDMSAGAEYLFRKGPIAYGPAAGLGLAIDNRSDELSFVGARLDIAFMLVYGTQFARVYGRPFISANLGTSVSFESKYSQYAEYSVPAATAGFELGLRLGHKHKKAMGVDLFLSVSSMMFKDEVYSRGARGTLGARFIFL